jgi:hypothetical protein
MLNESKYRAALGDFAQHGVSTEQCIKNLLASHTEWKQRAESLAGDFSIKDRADLAHQLQHLVNRLKDE